MSFVHSFNSGNESMYFEPPDVPGDDFLGAPELDVCGGKFVLAKGNGLAGFGAVVWIELPKINY